MSSSRSPEEVVLAVRLGSSRFLRSLRAGPVLGLQDSIAYLSFHRMRQHIVDMVGGRGTLRFFIQPTLAVVLGVIHGIRDHRRGRAPYLIGLVRARGHRFAHVGQALREILVPLCVAVIFSDVFQYVNRSRISPGYGLLYAVLFVAIPYFITRALANRVAGASGAHRWRMHGSPPREAR